MIDRVQYFKGHGTGNDFVILPDPDGQIDLTPGLVAAVCNRRFGLGADGVLRVVPAAKHPDGAGHAAEAEWFMDYRNADGSIAEMCGNGVRVFARFLVSSGLAAPAPTGLPIATRAGVVRARFTGDEIAVDMVPPRLYGESVATVIGAPDPLPGTAVDCGNPHLVCPLPAGVALDDLDLTRQPGFDAALFPAGVNIEFVVPAEPVAGADVHVRMRVHERGSGETLSCGSGALAVAAVALADARLEAGTVAVDLPGGRLTATFGKGGSASESVKRAERASDAVGGTASLCGPAVLLASGDLDVAALRIPR
jgi:diaminopimelate epimerase